MALWKLGSSGNLCASGITGYCKPELRGWFGQPNPLSWDFDRFAYADDARRFDHGTPAVLADVASQPGLDFVSATGVDVLARHNELSTAMLVERIAANATLTLVSPEKSEERGGSVMAQAVSVEKATAIMTALKSEIFIAIHDLRIIGICNITSDE